MIDQGNLFWENLNFSLDIQIRTNTSINSSQDNRNTHEKKFINDNNLKNLNKNDLDMISVTTNEKDMSSISNFNTDISFIDNLFYKDSKSFDEFNDINLNDILNDSQILNKENSYISNENIDSNWQHIGVKVNKNILKWKKINPPEKNLNIDHKYLRKLKKIQNFWNKSSKSLIQIFRLTQKKIIKNKKKTKKSTKWNKTYNTRSKNIIKY